MISLLIADTAPEQYCIGTGELLLDNTMIDDGGGVEYMRDYYYR